MNYTTQRDVFNYSYSCDIVVPEFNFATTEKNALRAYGTVNVVEDIYNNSN